MSRNPTSSTKAIWLSQKKGKIIAEGIALVLLGWGLVVLWGMIGFDENLQTSTLKTTFNKLNSTTVNVEIPEPGKLRISAGPSTLLGDATVFGIVLSSSEAQATSAVPFQVSSAFQSIFNLVDPTDGTIQLAFVFPQGRLATELVTLAELPFETSLEGQFEIRGISFGSTPENSFPPFSDPLVFIKSANILFDENGAAKDVLPPDITQPTPPQNPACSDVVDNDGDGKTDFPDDPGCEGPSDTEETEINGPEPLQLEILSQYLFQIERPSLSPESLVVLPPAQEELNYEFRLKTKGGNQAEISYGVRGKAPNINNSYPLENSGLLLRDNGVLEGNPGTLRGGNYRYQFFVTDGDQTLYFALQIAVYDAQGNPVGLEIETGIAGGEHNCEVGRACEAFFRTTKGIPPYHYSFTGESPTGSSFIQVNSGEAFYRFIPTAEQSGEYNVSLLVSDSAKRERQAGANTVETNNASSIDFTLVIKSPEPDTSFHFAGNRNCDFLDLSAVEPTFEFFQFTCRNGIIEGSGGLVREFDSINRAEAAKVTARIISDEGAVKKAFEPFIHFSPATPVNYSDVTVGDWYADFVYFLFQKGLIIDNTLYRPGDTLNIAEAMKLIIESYAPLNSELQRDLEDIDVYSNWYDPYQTIASYVDSTMAYLAPSDPALRGLMAELLYKLYKTYPSEKFE